MGESCIAMTGLRRSHTIALCRTEAKHRLARCDQGGLFWAELQVAGAVYRADRGRVSPPVCAA